MADAVAAVRNTRGEVIGEALVSEAGDIINIEISNALYARMFSLASHDGLAEGLILHPYFNHGIPRTMADSITQPNKENNNARTS